MCYNLELSLGTGIGAYIVSYILFQRNLTEKNKKIITMFMIFSTMQFADSLLWISNMKKNMLNYVTTSLIIPSLLILQIVYNIYVINEINHPFLNIFILIFAIHIFYNINGYSTPLCSNNYSSPVWGNYKINMLEIVIFAALVSFPNWKVFLMLLALAIMIKYYFKGAIGSWWCFINAFLGIFYYLTMGGNKSIF